MSKHRLQDIVDSADRFSINGCVIDEWKSVDGGATWRASDGDDYWFILDENQVVELNEHGQCEIVVLEASNEAEADEYLAVAEVLRRVVPQDLPAWSDEG